MNFNYLIYYLIFFSLFFSQSNDCREGFNSCNSGIFTEVSSSNISKAEFNKWEKKYADELYHFYQGYSSGGSNLDQQIQAAKKSLASKIAVTTTSDQLDRSNEESVSVSNNKILYDRTYEYSKATFKNIELIVVENKGVYVAHAYKCEYEYEKEKCILSNRLEEYYYGNVEDDIENIKYEV